MISASAGHDDEIGASTVSSSAPQIGLGRCANCRSCLVLNECRAWALAQGSGLAGIFGGMTAQARRLASRGSAA